MNQAGLVPGFWGGGWGRNYELGWPRAWVLGEEAGVETMNQAGLVAGFWGGAWGRDYESDWPRTWVLGRSLGSRL